MSYYDGYYIEERDADQTVLSLYTIAGLSEAHRSAANKARDRAERLGGFYKRLGRRWIYTVVDNEGCELARFSIHRLRGGGRDKPETLSVSPG